MCMLVLRFILRFHSQIVFIILQLFITNINKITKWTHSNVLSRLPPCSCSKCPYRGPIGAPQAPLEKHWSATLHKEVSEPMTCNSIQDVETSKHADIKESREKGLILLTEAEINSWHLEQIAIRVDVNHSLSTTVSLDTQTHTRTQSQNYEF